MGRDGVAGAGPQGSPGLSIGLDEVDEHFVSGGGIDRRFKRAEAAEAAGHAGGPRVGNTSPKAGISRRAKDDDRDRLLVKADAVLQPGPQEMNTGR